MTRKKAQNLRNTIQINCTTRVAGLTIYNIIYYMHNIIIDVYCTGEAGCIITLLHCYMYNYYYRHVGIFTQLWCGQVDSWYGLCVVEEDVEIALKAVALFG